MSLWQPQPITRAARGLVVPLAARGGERRPGGGGGGAGGHSSRRAAPPQRLLSRTEPDPDRKETVYTLRLATAPARGSALTDPAAGVVVCLVGRDGAALLHRVARLNDPETTEQEVRDICFSIDEREAGADCALAMHHAAAQREAGVGARLRFQEGSVDEVCFRAPDLGPLAALMVAPEGGRWVCDEVDVSSSRTGHTDRFVCREALGDGGAEPAAYLQPVPPGAVVYGSGGAAVVVTKEQAAALYSLNMRQYSALKAQLVGATAVLVGLGSGLAYAAGGRDLALPFALGGTSGVLYQFMLQVAVDSLGPGGAAPYEQQPGDGGGGGVLLRQLAGNPAARAAVVALVMAGLLQAVHVIGGGGGDGEAAASAPALFQVTQIVAALAGFLCYKAAVVGVALVPPPVDAGSALLQQSADAGGGGGGGAGGRARRGSDGPRD